MAAKRCGQPNSGSECQYRDKDAFEDARRIDAHLAIDAAQPGPVTDEAADREKLRLEIDRGNLMPGRGRGKLLAPGIDEWVGRNDKPGGLHFSELRERRFDLAIRIESRMLLERAPA